MKYLVSCLLVLPFITSCVEQDPYYEQNYYGSPPPRVEVQSDYSTTNRHHHNSHGYHRPAAPQGRIYHGHADVNKNRVIVNSPPSQVQVEVQQNAHGHGRNNNNVVGHSPATGEAVVVPGKLHNQGNHGGKQQHSKQAHGDARPATHGHN